MQKGGDEMKNGSCNRVLEKRPSWVVYTSLRVWFKRWGRREQVGVLLPRTVAAWRGPRVEGSATGALLWWLTVYIFLLPILLQNTCAPPGFSLPFVLKRPPPYLFFWSEFLSKTRKKRALKAGFVFFPKNMPANGVYPRIFGFVAL